MTLPPYPPRSNTFDAGNLQLLKDRFGALPKNPTTGFMRSCLEELGVSVRGKALSDKQLLKMLNSLGVPFGGDEIDMKKMENR